MHEFKESDNPLYRYPEWFEKPTEELLAYRKTFPTVPAGAQIILRWLRKQLAAPTSQSYLLHLGDSDAIVISTSFWNEPYPVEFISAHVAMSGFIFTKWEELLQYVRNARSAWLQQSAPAPMQFNWAAMEHVTIQLLKDLQIDFQDRTLKPLNRDQPSARKRKVPCGSLYSLPQYGLFSLFKEQRILVIGSSAHRVAELLSDPAYWEANEPWMTKSDMPSYVYGIGFPESKEMKSVELIDETLEKVKTLPRKPTLCLLACGMSAFLLAPRLAASGIPCIDIGSVAEMICGTPHLLGGCMPAFAAQS